MPMQVKMKLRKCKWRQWIKNQNLINSMFIIIEKNFKLSKIKVAQMKQYHNKIVNKNNWVNWVA